MDPAVISRTLLYIFWNSNPAVLLVILQDVLHGIFLATVLNPKDLLRLGGIQHLLIYCIGIVGLRRRVRLAPGKLVCYDNCAKGSVARIVDIFTSKILTEVFPSELASGDNEPLPAHGRRSDGEENRLSEVVHVHVGVAAS